MKILAVGAHPDDIEIGCGGTLARHAREGAHVTAVVVTRGGASGDPVRREAEAQAAAKILGIAELVVLDYPDASVPTGVDLVRSLEEVVARVNPDRAYIHYDQEIHQDHKTVSLASIAALRNCPQILMYEGPSTFPSFTVNFWVDVSGDTDAKERAISAHASQGHKEILKLEAIVAMNRYRGFQCRRQRAEGFHTFRFFE
jgi:LmbE family N-acetylglucosaminyl deacetylase